MNTTLEFSKDTVMIRKIYEAVPNQLKLSWIGWVISYLDKDVTKPLLDYNTINCAIEACMQNKELIHSIKDTEFTFHFVKLIKNIAVDPDNDLNADEIITCFNEYFLNFSAHQLIVVHHIESALTLFYYEKTIRETIVNLGDFKKFCFLDHFFWEVWDPLHLNETSARHEYYCYIPELIQRLKNPASKESIQEYFIQLYEHQFRKSYHEIDIDLLVEKVW